MAKFEVFIPPATPDGFNVTFRVDANNWMSALRIGLMKLGQQGVTAQNILVDVQEDGSVHITESESGRVFRIRELTEQEASQTKAKPGTSPLILDDRTITPKETPAAVVASQVTDPAIAAPVLEPLPAGAKTFVEQPIVSPPVSRSEAETAVARKLPDGPKPSAETIVEARSPAPAADLKKTLPGNLLLKPAQPAAPKAPPVSKMRKSSIPTRAGTRELMPDKVIELERPAKPVSGSIGREKKSAKEKKAELEDVLSDVFERVREVYEKDGVENALYFLLDLALSKIQAESGSVFRADPATGDLSFWAARGPKAREILDARIVVPAGSGIVGFCATEGVSVALSEVQRDPRYYSGVSEKVNYETRSVLCSPMMTHGRTFGAMQIINKKEGAVFAEYEVGLLSYIAHQGALYLNTIS